MLKASHLRALLAGSADIDGGLSYLLNPDRQQAGSYKEPLAHATRNWHMALSEAQAHRQIHRLYILCQRAQ